MLKDDLYLNFFKNGYVSHNRSERNLNSNMMNYLLDIKIYQTSFRNRNQQRNASTQKNFRSKNLNGPIGLSDRDGFGVVTQKELIITIGKGSKI